MMVDLMVMFSMSLTLFLHPGLRFGVKRDFCWLFGLKAEEVNERDRRRVADVSDKGAVYFQQLELRWR